MTGQAATLAEVARTAGVSIATASRALRGTAPVSPEAYQRVCAAAQTLQYVKRRPGPPPRYPDLVALLAHADHRRVYTDTFFQRVIAAASAELARHGVAVAVVAVIDATAAAVRRHLAAGRAAGAIVVGDHGPRRLADALPPLALPVISVGRSATGTPYVDVDNRAGARTAVTYLADRGRHTIVHIAGPPDVLASIDRREGYREALAACGIGDAPVAYGDFGELSAVHAMERLLDQRPRLDAVFAASDQMAAGALRALHRAGRRVPDDVAVVGFDDHPMAARLAPPLTTVHQPVEELGRRAAAGLLDVLAGRPVESATLPTALIHRASA